MNKDLLHSACPDFPSDRQVVHTMNTEKFYKIISGVLYVPSHKILMHNFLELDKYIEAVNNFAKMPDPNFRPEDNWRDEDLNRYTCADEADCVRAINEILIQSIGKYVACDIETSHVGWDDNKLLLIGFATAYNNSYVITHFTDPVLQALRQLFNCTDIRFIWHNGKFDTGRLKYIVDINARVDEDTMLMHYVGINERRGTHGLKELGPLYLQAPQWDDELQKYKKFWCSQHKVKLEEFTFDMLPRETIIPYLHMDALSTYRLFQVFGPLMHPATKNIYRTLVKASNVFRDIEVWGNFIDESYMYELEDILDEKIVQAERDLKNAVKLYWDPNQYMIDSGAKSYTATFNQKSPKQLKWMLEKITGKRLSSTDKDTLDELIQEFPNEPFISAIVNLRKLSKQMDTYVIGMRPMVCKDSRIRCTYNLHGTETGRLSSSQPKSYWALVG